MRIAGCMVLCAAGVPMAEGHRRYRVYDASADAAEAAKPLQDSFTQQLWDQHYAIANATYHDPFIRQLAAGTLPHDQFEAYIKQDDLYLVEYSRTMSLAAARIARKDTKSYVFVAKEALGALAEHDPFSNTSAGDTPMSSVNIAYSNLLVASASAPSVGLGMVAAVPCARLYAWLGQQLLAEGAARPSNPYRNWITSYANQTYQDWTDEFESIVNKYTAGASADEKEEAMSVYATAMTYERGFFAQAVHPTNVLPQAATFTREVVAREDSYEWYAVYALLALTVLQWGVFCMLRLPKRRGSPIPEEERVLLEK
eukprot:TRINITY_DN2134_c0_g1_i1.p1 TRINITY_DN2134_c0_g1~~TRINITY_DN2134_c0_g1_i1.p1  ORF type:complete len:313 (+),score=85.78 TRINITY_DN2134_c0_g1_i1:120-1058(+)